MVTGSVTIAGLRREAAGIQSPVRSGNANNHDLHQNEYSHKSIRHKLALQVQVKQRNQFKLFWNSSPILLLNSGSKRGLRHRLMT